MNSTRPLQALALRTGLWLAAAVLSLLLAPALVAPVSAATFGTVVPIGGQGSDIALDEPRGLLYIADFTASRIDVMSLADNSVHTSYNVAPYPGSLSLSPDGNYLVIVHFGNFVAPSAPANALTVISLNNNNSIQTFALGDPPLGVEFGNDGLALIVTTTNFILFDPVNGQTTVIDTIANITAHTLPVAPTNFPPNIIATPLNVSAAGSDIYGLSDTFFFHYSVLTHSISVVGYTSTPAQGPRVVSVSRDGSSFTAGWGLWSSSGVLVAEFPNPAGTLNVGSHAINSSAGLIYAQIPQGTAQSTAAPPVTPTTPSAPQSSSVAPPILQIVASDNLAVEQNLQLAENLAGKSLLSSKGDMLYSISDSGVTVFPVGYLNSVNRVQASKADLVFRGNICDSSMTTTQTVTISDPGGNQTDFELTPSIAGVSVSPSAGVTPATVTVTIDPTAFQNQTGTLAASISIQSVLAVNTANPIRVLINNHGPEDQGTFVDVPGTLVDVAADPIRSRFYILRQDQNEVLVYDSTSNSQIAALRTSNTPTSMAITMDGNDLIVGHDNSQLAYVYDLNSLQTQAPVVMPSGHYPRSVAVSAGQILVASRVAGPAHTIDVIDFAARTAYTPTTLGAFQNNINLDTRLASSANGGSIFAASANGTVMLYNASANSFVSVRQDFSTLSGAFAASNYGQYIVGNYLLDASLVLSSTLDSSTGSSSGFAFVDQTGLRTTAPAAQTAPGVIQRVATAGNPVRPTYIVEAPLLASGISVFTRTLAPLADQSAIISLTTSGFTTLPWNYDVAVAPPTLSSVVNAADFTKAVAPGGLISVFGSQLSPVNVSTNELPLPTSLGDSCLTVNGTPIPMMFVSSSQINAQLPFTASGDVTMVLRTAGGVSPNLDLVVQSNAPSVFHSGTAGPQTGIPTVVRASNNQLVTPSNPIHPKDVIVIYATGLGTVTPNVANGAPGPSSPLATAVVPPTITLGGAQLTVGFAGLAPGMVGVYQINAEVPSGVPTGLSIPLIVNQGGATTTLSVRVLN
jgi:uncharacterized protein (TIGR03437 family)